jgi:hypothetical protein
MSEGPPKGLRDHRLFRDVQPAHLALVLRDQRLGPAQLSGHFRLPDPDYLPGLDHRSGALVVLVEKEGAQFAQPVGYHRLNEIQEARGAAYSSMWFKFIARGGGSPSRSRLQVNSGGISRNIRPNIRLPTQATVLTISCPAQ